jgi:hypothetical protein
MLQIVPSKTNEERLLLVSPELASVLATIISRLRAENNGMVPLTRRYDRYEKETGPDHPCRTCSSTATVGSGWSPRPPPFSDGSHKPWSVQA